MSRDTATRSSTTTVAPGAAPELHYSPESDVLFIDWSHRSEPITCSQSIRLTASAQISPDGRIVGLMLRSLSEISHPRLRSAVASAQKELPRTMTVTLVGPDKVSSDVTVIGDATVRDIASSKYNLFWRTLKRNDDVVPFTAQVQDGDVVTIEDLPERS